MRVSAPDRISLDDFILEMMRIPAAELTAGRLDGLFRRLELSEELLRANVHFAKDAYARNLICRTPRFDMLLLCWRPGHVTTIHDHAGSVNVTQVFRGTLTSRTFEVAERPGPDRRVLRLAGEEQLGPGLNNLVDAVGIHQLANTSAEDLVTLHVYAPPLREITVYYPATGRFERVALRYTLEDEFA